MANATDIRYCTVGVGCDNTPSVSRFVKGATTAKGGAGALCRTASLHQREHRCCLHIDHIAGDLNVMADDASRLQALSDSAFLSHFNQSYSQERPWRLLHPKPEIVSKLISDVSGRQPLTPSRTKPAARTNESGDTGPNSPPASYFSSPTCHGPLGVT